LDKITDVINELRKQFIIDRNMQGDFNKYVQELIAKNSRNQNLPDQKRPKLDPQEIILLAQSVQGQARLKELGY